MIDEDVAYLSASTVYRILRAEELMYRQRGRTKRYREEIEKASQPDEIWATDLMYLKVGGVQYYLVTFIDEYSRYLVHWELLTNMDGHSISTAAQRAIETLPVNREGKLSVLAPMGTSLLSCRIGDAIVWQTEDGVRRLCVDAIQLPPSPGATKGTLIGNHR